MKKSISMAVLLSVSGIYTLSQTVLADTADATCEFYKRGDEKHDKWGTCSFSQRQGYIDITLKDGNTYNLSPRSEANQFNDREGHKVVRTQGSGNQQIYEWEKNKRKIVVTFYESMSANKGDAGAPVSSTDKAEVSAWHATCREPPQIPTTAKTSAHSLQSRTSACTPFSGNTRRRVRIPRCSSVPLPAMASLSG